MNTDHRSANDECAASLAQALWRIYRRPERPTAWQNGGNLPWNDPEFSQRMLREHLDESHGAASRTSAERSIQLEWLWSQLGLAPGVHLLDFTCGPGLYSVALAQRGCTITGIDFSPASIAYGRELAAQHGVSQHCALIEADVREVALDPAIYDAATFLYGQLAVFPRHQAQELLGKIANSLKPGGRLAIELLDQARVNKKNSTWWFTDHSGLWGDAPFLHLGERMWDADSALSLERFYTLHLDSGLFDEILLCDQTYAIEEMCEMLRQAGFGQVQTFPAWAGLPLYDAAEWVVYVAQR